MYGKKRYNRRNIKLVQVQNAKAKAVNEALAKEADAKEVVEPTPVADVVIEIVEDTSEAPTAEDVEVEAVAPEYTPEEVEVVQLALEEEAKLEAEAEAERREVLVKIKEEAAKAKKAKAAKAKKAKAAKAKKEEEAKKTD